MRVYVVLAMATHSTWGDNVRDISGVFSDKKLAQEFCDLKNKRAKYLSYIIICKKVDV